MIDAMVDAIVETVDTIVDAMGAMGEVRTPDSDEQ